MTKYGIKEEDEAAKNKSSSPNTKSTGSSPYYINPNENLAHGIINLKLNGTNYHLWSRSMRIALKTKQKLGFINGELPMPDEDDPKFDAWDQSNTTVVAWIINSLGKDTSEVVIDNNSALDLWKELQEKYGEVDSVRIEQLRAEISTCCQGTSTVTEYYNRLKNLWSEYVSFRPIPLCECGGSKHVGSRNTYAAMKHYQENDHVIDFAIGLNDEHANTKSQLLLMDPPPTLKVALKFSMKLERQLKGINKEVKTVDSVALAGAHLWDWNRDKGIRQIIPLEMPLPEYGSFMLIL